MQTRKEPKGQLMLAPSWSGECLKIERNTGNFVVPAYVQYSKYSGIDSDQAFDCFGVLIIVVPPFKDSIVDLEMLNGDG